VAAQCDAIGKIRCAGPEKAPSISETLDWAQSLALLKRRPALPVPGVLHAQPPGLKYKATSRRRSSTCRQTRNAEVGGLPAPLSRTESRAEGAGRPGLPRWVEPARARSEAHAAAARRPDSRCRLRGARSRRCRRGRDCARFSWSATDQVCTCTVDPSRVSRSRSDSIQWKSRYFLIRALPTPPAHFHGGASMHLDIRARTYWLNSTGIDYHR